jgi:hypothetical protein
VGRRIHYRTGQCHAVSENQNIFDALKPKAPEKAKTYGKKLYIRCSCSAGGAFDLNQVQTTTLNKSRRSSL